MSPSPWQKDQPEVIFSQEWIIHGYALFLYEFDFVRNDFEGDGALVFEVVFVFVDFVQIIEDIGGNVFISSAFTAFRSRGALLRVAAAPNKGGMRASR